MYDCSNQGLYAMVEKRFDQLNESIKTQKQELLNIVNQNDTTLLPGVIEKRFSAIEKTLEEQDKAFKWIVQKITDHESETAAALQMLRQIILTIINR